MRNIGGNRKAFIRVGEKLIFLIMKKLKSLKSFEESRYAIKSREVQRTITGGSYTIFVSDCGTNHEDYEVDSDGDGNAILA